jgi:pyrroloquinoline quinone biosynthesis protein D
MSEPCAPSREARPRLAPGVRLHFDARRDVWVLLAPERIIETDGPVHDIVSRCDGARTVAQIVDELARVYTAPAAEIGADVAELLDVLAAKRLVLL